MPLEVNQACIAHLRKVGVLKTDPIKNGRSSKEEHRSNNVKLFGSVYKMQLKNNH